MPRVPLSKAFPFSGNVDKLHFPLHFAARPSVARLTRAALPKLLSELLWLAGTKGA